MSPDRIFWTAIGALGAGIVGFCLSVHVFGISPRALFGSREMSIYVQFGLVVVGFLGWLSLLYRPLRHAFLDCAIVIALGMFLGLLVSRVGYEIYSDMLLTIVMRGAVYVGGLAMIRAWWVSRPQKDRPHEFAF